jgi:hypothetical protein
MFVAMHLDLLTVHDHCCHFDGIYGLRMIAIGFNQFDPRQGMAIITDKVIIQAGDVRLKCAFTIVACLGLVISKIF